MACPSCSEAAIKNDIGIKKTLLPYSVIKLLHSEILFAYCRYINVYNAINFSKTDGLIHLRYRKRFGFNNIGFICSAVWVRNLYKKKK